MQIAQVIGTLTSAIKDSKLSGQTLLITNVVDGKGAILEKAVVAVDTCGAGHGDDVLLVRGSAARMPAGVASSPVDATIVAIIDQITIT